jgi:hypothetical protein
LSGVQNSEIPLYSITTKKLPGDYHDWGICLIIFFIALFAIITLSNPALYLNDEWITVNQVHQLDIGHQITINEGKYGVYKNGTPSLYFADRNNILMYSLALPLFSLPALKIFSLFTDNFRLAVIAFWAFLPFFAALVLSACYPERAYIGTLRVSVIAAAAGFLLFAINFLYYSPFIWSAPDAPIEVAAVIFTNHILFALTMVVTYLIARLIFDGRWKALFTVIAGGACSAYLFWGANAKDHMATAFAFALVLYFLVRYIMTKNLRDAALGFFLIGILAWIRPEVGFSALLCFGAFVIADNFLQVYRGQKSYRKGFLHALTPLVTIIGSIPFFLNNLVISGNPLTPSFLIREKIKYNTDLVQVIPVEQTANVSHSLTSGPLAVANDFAGTIGHYFFSISSNPLSDIFGILFFPASKSMGLFLVSPLALLALLLLPFILLKMRTGAMHSRKKLILLLLVASGVIILSYIHNLDGLNTSHGIGPDIRYLSPLYLPAVLLGLIILEMTVLFVHPKVLVIRSALITAFLVPLLLIAVVLTYSARETDIVDFMTLFKILILIEVAAALILTFWYHATQRPSDSVSDLLLPLLVATVFAWQVMMIFVVSPATKFNGYTLWLPTVELMSNHFYEMWLAR